MREIKFRAWDRYKKRMKYFSLYDTLIMRFTLNTPEYKKTCIMQYIGLKDCKGKEIYEGDIVRCYSPQRCPHVVIWKDAGWYLSNLTKGYEWGGEEVIGNIYENPELLENDHGE